MKCLCVLKVSNVRRHVPSSFGALVRNWRFFFQQLRFRRYSVSRNIVRARKTTRGVQALPWPFSCFSCSPNVSRSYALLDVVACSLASSRVRFRSGRQISAGSISWRLSRCALFRVWCGPHISIIATISIPVPNGACRVPFCPSIWCCS